MSKERPINNYGEVQTKLLNQRFKIDQEFNKLKTPFLKNLKSFFCRWNIQGGFPHDKCYLPVYFKVITPSELNQPEELKLDLVIEYDDEKAFNLIRPTFHYDPNNILWGDGASQFIDSTGGYRMGSSPYFDVSVPPPRKKLTDEEKEEKKRGGSWKEKTRKVWWQTKKLPWIY